MAMTAHDLRNVFNNILGLSRILEEKTQEHPNPDIHELIHLILSQCQLGLGITSGILHTYEATTYSLNELIDSLLNLYKYKVQSKSIALYTHIPSEDILVNVPAELFARTLENLLDNSIKFTPQNGSITITLSEDAGNALVSIKDTGIGIPEPIRPLIFQKQTEGQRVGTEGEASHGLGLYISKQLVESMGGRLWFESQPNQGTVFYLSLKIVP